MRIKGGVTTRQRKKKTFRLAKGYYSDRGRRWRLVKQQVERSLRFATIDRRNKKRVFRKLWIARVNAAAREAGLTYSKLIHGLKVNNVTLNRKTLAHLAMHDNKSFKELIELVQSTS